MKEFEWFEWFEWFGPSPIEPFNSGDLAAVLRHRRRQEAEGALAVLAQVLQKLTVLAGVHERRLAITPKDTIE